MPGYRASFPFLAPEVFAVQDGAPVRLYRRIAALDRPGLYSVGLVQPVGPTIPLVEVQARWLAGVLAGRLAPAGAAAMETELIAHHQALARTYVGSARYALEVDYKGYAGQLNGAMRAGRA
ncbi:hypothetical protein Q8W71_28525 [Methylobacterium sp. NEAU 140]|uniref:hypothetical protein n=1 Tax=Methylobacterium sp. NEAU 140 TaxID=3064945 RepID=UPI002732390B|nr:hypothetical protein [Methylobacterium sp. NEAU 140]MDP4026565.1 hypothetical protein [Methylobacterium sp. NEAU 140]